MAREGVGQWAAAAKEWWALMGVARLEAETVASSTCCSIRSRHHDCPSATAGRQGCSWPGHLRSTPSAAKDSCARNREAGWALPGEVGWMVGPSEVRPGRVEGPGVRERVATRVEPGSALAGERRPPRRRRRHSCREPHGERRRRCSSTLRRPGRTTTCSWFRRWRSARLQCTRKRSPKRRWTRHPARTTARLGRGRRLPG